MAARRYAVAPVAVSILLAMPLTRSPVVAACCCLHKQGAEGKGQHVQQNERGLLAAVRDQALRKVPAPACGTHLVSFSSCSAAAAQ